MPEEKDELPLGTFASETQGVSEGAEAAGTATTGAEAPTPPQPIEQSEINIESSGADFVNDLNKNLLGKLAPDVMFSVSVNTLRGFLISAVSTGKNNQLLSEGVPTIQPGNRIDINGLKIKTKRTIGAGFLKKDIDITLDLGISLTNSNHEGVIDASLISCSPGIAEGAVSEELTKLNDAFKNIMNQQIARENPNWRTQAVSIAGERILVGFHNANA